jgi:hypothetical protein
MNFEVSRPSLCISWEKGRKEAFYMKKTKKELERALAVERKNVGELRAQVDGLKDHAFYLMLTRKKN